MITEKELTTQVRSYLMILANQGLLWSWRDEISCTWESHTHRRSNKAGFPDFLVVLNVHKVKEFHLANRNLVLFVELKSEKGRLSKDQRELSQWVNDTGACVVWHTVRSLEELQGILSELFEEGLI